MHGIPRLLPKVRYAGLALLLVVGAPRAATAGPLAVDLRVTAALGGETIAEVAHEDGRKDSLHLGDAFLFGGGPVLRVLTRAPHAVDVAAVGGFGGYATPGDDGVELYRSTFELLAYYRYAIPGEPMDLNFALGPAWHFIGHVRGTGRMQGARIPIEDGHGWVAEAGFGIYGLRLGFRYTAMRVAAASSATARDASSFGVMFGACAVSRPL